MFCTVPFARRPAGWLVLQAAVLAAVLFAAGRCSPRPQPDTPSYAQFPLGDGRAALRHSRTIGYPLLLRAAALWAPDYRAAPAIQLGIHVAAVLVFYGGLRRATGRRGLSLAAASSLLYSNVLLRYGADVTADSMASSLAIAAMGLLFLLVARPRSAWVWCLLTLAIAAAYHTRPAYVFLPLTTPLLGVWLARLLRCEPGDAGRRRRFALGLAAAALTPLLLYCSLRWAVVGRFGLVAFGGHNLIGVAGQFLTPELAAEAPEDLRTLALRAVSQRRRRGWEAEPATGWSYRRVEQRFDATAWEIFHPAARELYGRDQPAINGRLWRLGLWIAARRPRTAAVWLAKATVRGVQVMVSGLAGNPVYFLAAAALLAARLRWALRIAAGEPPQRPRRDQAVDALLLAALVFAGAKLAVVVLTSPPLGRFMDAAGVLLPTPLAAGLADQLAKRAPASGAVQSARPLRPSETRRDTH